MSFKLRQGSAAIVDEVAFNRKLLRSVLRSSGFNRVSEYEDLDIALDESKRIKPDFLFIDYKTALTSEQVRSQQNLHRAHLDASTHLIVLMQNATRLKVQKAMACGAHWVIARPFSPRSLTERLQAIYALQSRADWEVPQQPMKRSQVPMPHLSSNKQTETELRDRMSDLLTRSLTLTSNDNPDSADKISVLAEELSSLENQYKTSGDENSHQTEESIFLI